MVKKCIIVGCGKAGRVIGRLGDIELVYCAKHEDMGNRALNFLLNSMYRHRLTKFIEEKRTDIFSKGVPELCEKCNEKIKEYVNKSISEIDEINK